MQIEAAVNDGVWCTETHKRGIQCSGHFFTHSNDNLITYSLQVLDYTYITTGY